VCGYGWFFTSRRHHHHYRPAGRPGSRRPGRSRLGLESVSRLLLFPRGKMRTLVRVTAAAALATTVAATVATALLLVSTRASCCRRPVHHRSRRSATGIHRSQPCNLVLNYQKELSGPGETAALLLVTTGASLCARGTLLPGHGGP
jgi:hypothetical protein